MKVVTAAQMKQIERGSLDYGMTFARLMENAGSAAAAFIRRTFNVEGLNCLIFCGHGNNGGDGFVAARKLFEHGANVVIVLVDGPPSTEEAQAMLHSAELLELRILSLPEDIPEIAYCVQQADIVIDAIYGAGFHGSLTGNAKIAGEMISDAIAAVISLDIPSGVECDTARAFENAVKADFTTAFDTLRPAHLIKSGMDMCGRIELLDIGIPDEAHEGVEGIFRDITADMVYKIALPRGLTSHKGDYGTLLCICGSSRYRGAAALAALGSLRCGVGICEIASVEAVCSSLSASLYEPVYLPLPTDSDGYISSRDAIPLLEKRLGGASAVLFGCGLGNTPETASLLLFVLKNAKAPVIVDADGINALAANINILQDANIPVILTPHPGEMARLCGLSTPDVQSDRIGTAQAFAVKHGVTLVLKGNETLVALSDGSVLINHTGGPGLAKGGSGDILSGMLGAFIAQGMPPETASACAVYLHGLAGDRAAARLSERAMLPSELLFELTDIFGSMER